MSYIIKELNKDERPRERLIKYGRESLSDCELLAIMLKTGFKNKNVIELANELLIKFNNLNNLKDITIKELKTIKGIGEVKAIEIISAIELGKRIYLKQLEVNSTYKSAKEIYENSKYLFNNLKQEYFYCLYFDNKQKLIERKLLFMGTINQSTVHPREVFKHGLVLSASTIVCMHNHPSDDVTPSRADIDFTQCLTEIGKLIKIPVVDHIIVGSNNYYSFYDNNLIK